MMQKPTLYQMLEYLGVILTPQMKSILRALRKGEVDENKLAETLKVRVNDIRKLMYILSHNGHVKYTKQKSESKQWWYIYLWRLDMNKIKSDYIFKKRRELADIKERLDKARRSVFRCAKCGIEFSVEQALEAGYICHECDSPLSEIKRQTSAAKLEREVARLEKDIKVCK
jgi:transcription initiation factor TFIIE subunit alpha